MEWRSFLLVAVEVEFIFDEGGAAVALDRK